MRNKSRNKLHSGIIGGSLLCVLLFVLLLHSNTRLGLFLNHDLVVPQSAHDIKINSCRNFLCLDGDGSVAYFTIPREDFEVFLKKQICGNQCRGEGPFQRFSDSLLHRYPIEVGCKAPRGDALLITADTIRGNSELRIGLYTDWN